MIDRKDIPCFNTETVKVRDLIRAQYHTWPEPRNGLIVSVKPDTVLAIFLPAIHQSVCYFRIKAEEVGDGKWKISHIRFSGDDGWEMTIGGEDFANEYTGSDSPAEDAADTPEADGEQQPPQVTSEIW